MVGIFKHISETDIESPLIIGKYKMSWTTQYACCNGHIQNLAPNNERKQVISREWPQSSHTNTKGFISHRAHFISQCNMVRS